MTSSLGKIFGEGPASKGVALSAQGFNEGKGKPFTAADVRYTASKDGRTLYVIVMGVPTEALRLEALGRSSSAVIITAAHLLGAKASLAWRQLDEALVIEPSVEAPAIAGTLVVKLTL